MLDGIYSKLSADGGSPIPVFSHTDAEIRMGLVEPGVASRACGPGR
jgi:hypothetical protein